MCIHTRIQYIRHNIVKWVGVYQNSLSLKGINFNLEISKFYHAYLLKKSLKLCYILNEVIRNNVFFCVQCAVFAFRIFFKSRCVRDTLIFGIWLTYVSVYIYIFIDHYIKSLAEILYLYSLIHRELLCNFIANCYILLE